MSAIVAAALHLHCFTGQILRVDSGQVRVGCGGLRIFVDLTRDGFIIEIRKTEKDKNMDKDVIMMILRGMKCYQIIIKKKIVL